MDRTSNYIFLPCFSLQPNKVTSYNSVFIQNKTNETIKSIHEFKKPRKPSYALLQDLNVINRSSHNFNISDNAYRNLKQKISWLYYLSKSKQVKTYNGNAIFNFKIGFITLTLPSKQQTNTSTVTKELLNPFLTEIRQRTNMENYVWRLEFQKNGNVHYHIVTDTYLDYHFIRKIWNRLLESKGYIEPYRNKMKSISLSEYVESYKNNKNITYPEIVKNYARNKSENWSNPNSVDVKSVISNKAISNYISKYFAKTSDTNPIKNEFDNDENSKSIRLWFCSRSLSKLKSISNFCEAVEYDIFAILSYSSKVKKIVGAYATSYYFEIKDFVDKPRKWLEMILKKYSIEKNYIPSS